MGHVYEGVLRENWSNIQGYVLTKNGLFYNGSQVSTKERFYFFDLDTGKMFRSCPCHGVQEVRNKDRIDDRENSKIYLFNGDEWIIVRIPSPLPEIKVRFLSPGQEKYNINVPKDFILIPLKSSNFYNLEDRVIDVSPVNKSATLAYISIDPISYVVTIVYELLVREINGQMKSFIHLGSNYYADSEHGKIEYFIPGATEVVSIEPLNDLVATTQEVENGIKIIFIHAIEGNEGIPEDTSVLPRSNFEEIKGISRNTRCEFKALIHPASRNEIINVTYLDKSGEKATVCLILNICSLYDHQSSVSIDVYPENARSDYIDVSEEVSKKVPGIAKASDIYYISNKDGYLLTDKSKLLVVKTCSKEINSSGCTVQRQLLIGGKDPRICNVFIHIHSRDANLERLLRSMRKIKR